MRALLYAITVIAWSFGTLTLGAYTWPLSQ